MKVNESPWKVLERKDRMNQDCVHDLYNTKKILNATELYT